MYVCIYVYSALTAGYDGMLGLISAKNRTLMLRSPSPSASRRSRLSTRWTARVSLTPVSWVLRDQLYTTHGLKVDSGWEVYKSLSMKQIIRRSVAKTFEEGQQIYRLGDEGKDLWMILKGSVRLKYLPCPLFRKTTRPSLSRVERLMR